MAVYENNNFQVFQIIDSRTVCAFSLTHSYFEGISDSWFFRDIELLNNLTTMFILRRRLLFVSDQIPFFRILF